MPFWPSPHIDGNGCWRDDGCGKSRRSSLWRSGERTTGGTCQNFALGRVPGRPSLRRRLIACGRLNPFRIVRLDTGRLPSFGLLDFRCSQSSQLLRRIEIVRPQSSFNQRECGAQRLHSRRVRDIGNGPIAQVFAGVELLHVETRPVGTNQAVDRVMQMRMCHPDCRRVGRESRMLSSGSDLLDCIGAKCGRDNS